MVITYKNFLMKYKNIAGISATVDDDIFSELYELAVEKIPTNKPIIRQDKPDILLQTNEERLQAIVGDIMMINKSGQPILIGTTNISDAIILSNELTKHSVQHNLLHANHLLQEAEIIKNAGIFGAVTIAAQMAGRGTDILLGGNNANAESAILQLGGLCVLGFGRSKQRRADAQLVGRAGRQGNAGATQFYLSMEDDLIDGRKIHSVEEDIKKIQEENRLEAKNLLTQEAKRRNIEFECIKILLELRSEILYQRYDVVQKIVPNFAKEKINLVDMDRIIQEFVDFSDQVFKNLCFQSFAYKDVFVEYKKRLLNYLDNILFAEDIKNAA
jgi:preprotein translocase subunit SecA